MWLSGQCVGLAVCGPGFQSCSDHYQDLFLSSPEFKSSATPVNSQLLCLQPVDNNNNVMFNLN